MNASLYPPSPSPVNEEITRPTPAFKQEALRVMGAIVFFIFVYLLLLVAAVVLTGICTFLGILVMGRFGLLSLLLGIGMIGLGVMVLFFLIKFIFSYHKVDQSHLIRVHENEQPELFAFIRQLTKEVGAPFPRKIFFTTEVNAYVFYNSSFWSMFLPVRKNLVIGLGLVNAVNISEFKAIMAHEFGHFSQRSMKLGSYIYNVNRVIYNMLYDNEGLGRSLEGWGSIHGIFSIFSAMTIGILRGIQSILKEVYAMINKSYMSLSRQMEFHADAVAASVSGSESLVTALRRLEVADGLYQQNLREYNDWVNKNKRPANAFAQHRWMLQHFAERNELPQQEGLPVLTSGFFEGKKTTRVVVKDQWASHPATEDREEHLRKLNVQAALSTTPAWKLFRDQEKLEADVTKFLYRNVNFKNQPEEVSVEKFAEDYQQEVEHYKLDPTYRGFYDNRTFPTLEEISLPESATLQSILTEETLSLPSRMSGMQTDIYILEQIIASDASVKSFEFDGKKYPADAANDVLATVKHELEECTKQLAAADNQLYSFFLRQARQQQREHELRERYSALSAHKNRLEEDTKTYQELSSVLSPIFQGQVTVEQAYAVNNQAKLHERPMRERISKILLDTSLDAADRATLEKFNRIETVYFNGESFNDLSLASLTESMSIFYRYVNEQFFQEKKELLAWQAQIFCPKE